MITVYKGNTKTGLHFFNGRGEGDSQQHRGHTTESVLRELLHERGERETKLVYGRSAKKPHGGRGESTADVAIVRAGGAVGGSVRAEARAVTARVLVGRRFGRLHLGP